MKSIFFFLLFVPTFLFAQELKKITEGNKYEKFVYHVLKSDPKIKHGNYQVIHSKKIMTNGFYKNGLMDSIWTEYTYSGILKIEGTYLEGKKVGAWRFYDYKGEIEQVYDYTKNKMIHFKVTSTDLNFRILDGEDTVVALLDTPPLYIGGKKEMMKSIMNNMHYPEKARKKNENGNVWISFMIGPDGKAYGHAIDKGFEKECDQEALRIIMLMSNNWTAGILNGKPVTTQFVIPVNFTLE